MKKLIALFVAIAILFTAGPALADNIKYSVGTYTDSYPYQDRVVYSDPATIYDANPRTNTIEVELAGKTCSFMSSYAPGGSPRGCNYYVEVEPDGEITVPSASCRFYGCE